ncbi:MAG: DUF4390 domain-containing protein [Thermodesulfovibrionales bacterium]|jgi:hypothetical protein
MKENSTFILILLISALFFIPAVTGATEVGSVHVRINNNEIYVAASLKPDPKVTEDITAGLSKEFAFYIDLFRVWNIWPDEFVTGKKIVKVLSCDPIKREYTAENIEGNIHTVKRFRDADAMVSWATNLPEIRLAGTKELEPGTYFVKVTAESLLKKLPPVIGYLLFFVPEKEFTVSRDSSRFPVNNSQNGR